MSDELSRFTITTPAGDRSRRRLLEQSMRAVTGALAVSVLSGCQSRAETTAAALVSAPAADSVASARVAPARNVQLAMAGLPTDDGGLLNYALAFEYEAIAAYQAAIGTGLMLHPVLDAAQQFQSDHRKHAELLVSTVSRAGSGAVKTRTLAEYAFPLASLRSQSDLLRFLATKEKASADAYLAVVPQFTNRDLARVAASILGTETMHWAVLLGTLGENAVPSPFLS